MNTKTIFGALILGVLLLASVAILFLWSPAVREQDPVINSTSISSESMAISAVIAQNSELEAYRTESLPPSSIETKEQAGGWSVAFIQRGSGAPGILKAQCYYVSTKGAVLATGQYTGNNLAGVDTLNIENCTPDIAPAPETPPPGSDPLGKCYIGGCSSQLCTDQPDAVSSCIYNESYACFKTATCKRQVNGACGWTQTPELNACLVRGQE